MADNNAFSWDDPAEVDNFFNDSPEDLEKKIETATVIEEINKDDVVEKTAEELADDIFADESDILEDVEEEEQGEESTDTKAKSKSKDKEESTTSSALNLLKDKGILDFELEEGEELTEELAEEILEDKFDEAIEGRIGELFAGLPDVVKQMIKFAKDGGDPTAFVQTLAQATSTGLTTNMDMSQEANQEAVMKTMLKKDGYDDEDISTQIEFLKDSGKLKAMAEKRFDVWNKNQEKETAALTAAQENKRKQDREELRERKATLISELQTTTEVDGIKLNSKDKREIPSYIFDKNIELENGSKISSYHKDVWEAMSNKKASLQLAKLLRERKKDGSFDFSKIEKIAETAVTRKVKDNVQRNKNITPQVSVGKISSQKSLADYF